MMKWLDGITDSVMGVRLFVTPTDYSLLGSSVHGILQARILEWAAINGVAQNQTRLKELSSSSSNSSIQYF